MRIKRFVTADMRQAIRQIREEMGPDAVILSNRKTDEGVEITAAVDYEALLRTDTHTPAAPERGVRKTDAADVAPVRHLATQAGASGAQAESLDQASGLGGESGVDGHSHTLATINDEIRSLRGLLEDQLGRLAWSERERCSPLRTAVLRELAALGISPRVAAGIADAVPDSEQPESAWRCALAILAHRIAVTDDDILSDGGIVALLGATGVGKTTTVAKLAARFALRHGPDRVALITTDSYRIGASEQLRTFAHIMGIPLRVVNDEHALRDTIGEFYDRRLVLIDTAGMNQRDQRFSIQIKLVAAGSPVVRTYLVLSATAQHAGLEEAMRAFGPSRLDGCVITKVDESTSLGPALSVVLRHATPVAYVSTGQRVPEDISPARSHQLVSRAVALARSAASEDDQLELPAEEARTDARR